MIKKLNLKALTKAELQISYLINGFTSLFISLYQNAEINKPANKKIVYTSKREGDGKGEWGYYVSSNIGALAVFLKRNKITSFLDMGCGAGILLGVLQRYLGYETKVNGFDNEKSLLEYCHKTITTGAYYKNLFTITKDDIKKYEVLYFYEPMADAKLAEKFVKNLASIVTKGQFIIYLCAGSIGYFLEQQSNIKKLDRFSGFNIYEVI